MLPEKNRLPTLVREGSNECFACGESNPIGLKLRFYRNNKNEVITEFNPQKIHQGWPGIMHGGILFTIMDEAMGYTLFPEGVNCVTAKTEVRFRQPAPIGETLLVTASISKRTSRLIETKSKVSLKSGAIVAESKAVMYIVSTETNKCTQ